MECQLCGGSGWCPGCDGFGNDDCDLCEQNGLCPDCVGTGKDTNCARRPQPLNETAPQAEGERTWERHE